MMLALHPFLRWLKYLVAWAMAAVFMPSFPMRSWLRFSCRLSYCRLVLWPLECVAIGNRSAAAEYLGRHSCCRNHEKPVRRSWRCNEDKDRYSNTRRILHHFTMYGFLLCFASTSTGTIYHYFLNYPAPYPLFSLPKLFGISGGVSLSLGTLGLMWLKTKSDDHLDAAAYRSGDFAFVLAVLVHTGLLLYVQGLVDFLVAEMLILHLGAVLTLFLLLPYSKMAHGFYRFAALVQDAVRNRSA